MEGCTPIAPLVPTPGLPSLTLQPLVQKTLGRPGSCPNYCYGRLTRSGISNDDFNPGKWIGEPGLSLGGGSSLLGARSLIRCGKRMNAFFLIVRTSSPICGLGFPSVELN